ncbi:MAG: S-layer homology domain-containing protein [Clostridia bacterium]|nr:S-layer homology domain-containing protein [Clostridia bacterium]
MDFIAAREITSGTGDNQFSPEAKLTRAQFVVLLMNTYQINPQNQGASSQIQNFTDAGST